MKLSNMITAVDTHAGTPMRVITGGVVNLPGESIFDKMKWLQTEGDDLRQRMLREPRGYPAMCCNLILPPSHPEADAGFIIMEQTEWFYCRGFVGLIPESCMKINEKFD
jgi:proline racemase